MNAITANFFPNFKTTSFTRKIRLVLSFPFAIAAVALLFIASWIAGNDDEAQA